MSRLAGRWLVETRAGRIAFLVAAVTLIVGAAYAVIREEVGRQTDSITKRVRVIEEVSPYDVVAACLRSPRCRAILEEPDRGPDRPKTDDRQKRQRPLGSGGPDHEPSAAIGPEDIDAAPEKHPPAQSEPAPDSPSPSPSTGKPAGQVPPSTGEPGSGAATGDVVDQVTDDIGSTLEEADAAVDSASCSLAPSLCTK